MKIFLAGVGFARIGSSQESERADGYRRNAPVFCRKEIIDKAGAKIELLSAWRSH